MGQTTANAWWVVSVVSMAFIAWYAARGWRMGAVRTVVWIFGLILALWCGLRFGGAVSEFLGDTLPTSTRHAVAFVCVVLAVTIAVDILGAALGKVFDFTPFSLLNKAAGAFLGAVKASVLIAVLGVFLVLLPGPPAFARTYNRSGVVQTCTAVGSALADVVEPRLPEIARRFMHETRSAYAERMQGKSPASPETTQPLHAL